jgi:hypothetical protein
VRVDACSDFFLSEFLVKYRGSCKLLNLTAGFRQIIFIVTSYSFLTHF